jgi:hypothetical protein
MRRATFASVKALPPGAAGRHMLHISFCLGQQVVFCLHFIAAMSFFWKIPHSSR